MLEYPWRFPPVLSDFLPNKDIKSVRLANTRLSSLFRSHFNKVSISQPGEALRFSTYQKTIQKLALGRDFD
jgi:hypothetical protein